jgi:hypothetical protein
MALTSCNNVAPVTNLASKRAFRVLLLELALTYTYFKLGIITLFCYYSQITNYYSPLNM